MRLMLLLITLLALHTTVSAKEPGPSLQPLQLGLLPYLSIHQLVKSYLPLKKYLEQRLGRTVVVTSAPDYHAHLLRVRDNAYDIYLTAPHMAALAEKRWHARRLTAYKRRLQGDLVVDKNSSYQKISDLKNKMIVAPGNYAIVTMLADSLFRQHGLIPGQSISIQPTASHNNALLAVIRRYADAAVVSAAVFESWNKPGQQNLRVLASTQSVPHAMFMASAHLSESDFELLLDAFMHFTADGSGKKFFEHTGYIDMMPITDAQMRELEPFAEELKRLLGAEFNS